MKILVADDEIHITTLLKITLEMHGYTVMVANDGAEALEKVEADLPDLVLLDIKMPQMNGWQVCEKLKSDERTKNIPVLILTNFGQKEKIDQCLNLGAEDYLIKAHFVPSEVIDRIKKIIGS